MKEKRERETPSGVELFLNYLHAIVRQSCSRSSRANRGESRGRPFTIRSILLSVHGSVNELISIWWRNGPSMNTGTAIVTAILIDFTAPRLTARDHSTISKNTALIHRVWNFPNTSALHWNQIYQKKHLQISRWRWRIYCLWHSSGY